MQKPLIQTGELSGTTKNSLRNAIVRRARRDGADAVFFDSIADNQLQNQQILFAMDNADIGYRGMVRTPFKQGNWQSPKSIRNQVLNGHLKSDDAVQMFKEYGTQFPEDMVRLYRASGTSGNFKPSLDGTAKYSGM